MPGLIWLVLGNIGATMWLNEKTVHPDKDQKGPPTIFGYDARNVLMGLGAVEIVTGLVPGALGGLLIGAGLGAYGSKDAQQRYTKAFAEFTAKVASLSGPEQKAVIDQMEAWAAAYQSAEKVAGDVDTGTHTGLRSSALPGMC